jgi:hypothetical protein
MWKPAGDLSYVGFTEDGAQWLVDNTDIKLVGKLTRAVFVSYQICYNNLFFNMYHPGSDCSWHFCLVDQYMHLLNLSDVNLT